MKRLKKILALFMCILMINGIFICGERVYASESTSIDQFFVSEDNYQETMENEIEPYIDSIKKTGYMDIGESDFKIYYEKYKVENSKASIVLLHGKGESLEVYNEMMYYFIKSGYSVYGLEMRGFARSGRLGVKDETQINVDSFNSYISDLKQFLDEIVIPEAGKDNLFVFAHSMGGVIAARYLEIYPGDFKAAVLNSPMFTIDTGKIPEWIAKIIVDPSRVFPYGDEYAAGQKPYTGPGRDVETSGTSSQARLDYYYKIRLEDPELSRGGVSYRWLQSAIDFTMKARCAWNASKVEVPVLLFQAEKDTYVKPEGQNKFAKFAKNCTLVKKGGAKHEMYREQDYILKPWLVQVLDFYQNNI